MEENVLFLLKNELSQFKHAQIDAVLKLLDEGNTLPFIARYRKEMTGSLDELEIKLISDKFNYIQSIEKRKEEVLRLIEEQGKLTPELEKDIKEAQVLQLVEDLYRPYKQKRRTKAVIAKEAGLEPLALLIQSLPKEIDINAEANKYLNDEILTVEDALLGAHEIMAESIGDSSEYRTYLRDFTFNHGLIESVVKDAELDERKVYEMYYEFKQNVKGIQGHRVLALNRAEKENVIRVSIKVDLDQVHSYFKRRCIGIKNEGPAVALVEAAYIDAYKRFIGPAIERELRSELTEQADSGAIEVFGENLRNLLLQAPLKNKVVMGFDPAYRSGCKLAIVDETGKVLKIKVIFPHASSAARHQESIAEFKKLIVDFKVDVVAVGNGTASRESEAFVAEHLKGMPHDVFYLIVNEAGASVYSASDVARKEFPDLQVEERSAISIARRIQDPLAELVKIDPQSVGVGQYQHDVSQKNLSEKLDFVVETAVNQVGVDVNTASAQLLAHVAGLTMTTAQNIVKQREAEGAFKTRAEIKSVPRLGPKSFEQSIGFLRIIDAENILDSTGIHPESYKTVKDILKDHKVSLNDLGTEDANVIIKSLNPTELAKTYDVGVETLHDILNTLSQPGRDFRDDMSSPLLRSDVLEMEDLKPGMELNGTVRNVVDFGAFVDIGVKQDGLVHISKLSKQFIKHPSDIVAVGDVVKVWVMDVDLQKQRIQLTMIKE